MFNSEQLQEKWQPVLNHPDLPEINDAYKRAVTAVILENQERELKESRQVLAEAEMSTGDAVANWDPVLISLVRRAMPSLIAYDVCGVQPMSGPTGLIFAMKARSGEGATSVAEALHDEANTALSSEVDATAQLGSNPGALNGGTAGVTTDAALPDIWGVDNTATYDVKGGHTTAQSEALSGSGFQDMGFSIEKATVTAKSRALRAGYTMELAQDLKAIHGLDAESELSNILSQEILQEINREVIRTIYITAEKGAIGTTADGIFDLDTDSNGRWSVEKFKGLLFQIERDCNAIGVRTRRGKGNILMCSADTASALSMAGVLDYAPAMSTNMNVDPSGSTFAGTINGRIKVYVDPYASAADGASDWYVAGYRGSSAYDAGIFYCPYVPLQMVRAVSEDTFQPRIAFKTRYGMAVNPFSKVGSTGAIDASSQPFSPDNNCYYRRAKVTNIM
tara:strand:- start:2247 stop:3596 length:1350 start_codon:yes stop_codon:yes gene_type:complete